MNLITNNNRVSTSVLYDEPYLAHHGIKGMKWGVRRYQNEDGSLTAAGRKRYGADLDINDVSRVNIARIRKGEAYRRLDTARANNGTNNTRIAELQGRVRSAKKAERQAKSIDRGAKRSAKGETILDNRKKAAIAFGAAVLANRALVSYLNTRLSDLGATGKWTPNHQAVAQAIATSAGVALSAGYYGYAVKKAVDNRDIRAYRQASWSGRSSKKYIGSTEYADVVKRRG